MAWRRVSQLAHVRNWDGDEDGHPLPRLKSGSLGWEMARISLVYPDVVAVCRLWLLYSCLGIGRLAPYSLGTTSWIYRYLLSLSILRLWI